MVSITRFGHFLTFLVLELAFCCFNATFYYEIQALFPFSRNRIIKACFQVEVKTAATPTPKFPLHYTKALYHP